MNDKKKKNFQTILYSILIILNIIFILLLLDNLQLRRNMVKSQPLHELRKSAASLSKILTYGDRIGSFQAKDIKSYLYNFNFSASANNTVLVQFFNAENRDFAREILSYENLLWERYKKRNFFVLGVCHNDAILIKRLIENENLSFPVVADTNFFLHKMFGVEDENYAMFLVNKNGYIVYSCTCGLDRDNLRQLIEYHVLGFSRVIPENINIHKELTYRLKKLDLINIENQSRHFIGEFLGNIVLVTIIANSCNTKNIKKRIEFLKHLKKDPRFSDVLIICLTTIPAYRSYVPGYLKKSGFPIFFIRKLNIDPYWTRNRYPNPFTILLNQKGEVLLAEKKAMLSKDLKLEIITALKNL